MAFNPEDLIKFSDLAPSLQALINSKMDKNGGKFTGPVEMTDLIADNITVRNKLLSQNDAEFDHILVRNNTKTRTLTVDETMTVGGNSTLRGTLSVTGKTTVNELSGNTIKGTSVEATNITGNTSVKSPSIIATGNNGSVSGPTVTGDTGEFSVLKATSQMWIPGGRIWIAD